LVQQVSAAGVEGEIAECVNQQDIRRGPCREASVQSVSRLARDEVVDEVGRAGEADAVPVSVSALLEADGARTEHDQRGRTGPAIKMREWAGVTALNALCQFT